MNLSGPLHQSTALSPETEVPVPFSEGGQAPQFVWTIWRREKVFPCPKSKPVSLNVKAVAKFTSISCLLA
jgi:hypothetical protein